MNSSHLIWGPPDDTGLGDVTFAELIYNSLLQKNPSDTLLIEENTGEEIPRGKLLQSTVKIAIILQELGISEGDTVGVITHNTWKYFVPGLAALFLGVAFSPINPSSTKDELCRFLNVSQPKVLFVSRVVLDAVREIKKHFSFLKHVIILDEEDVLDGELAFDELLSREVNSKRFQIQKRTIGESIIIYSSGTTGFPKGVVLSQDNILCCMKYCRFKVPIRQLYGLSECIVITVLPPNLPKPGSVGKVVIGHNSKVVDRETGTILGPNISGEICFKGPCVMQGYKNNDEATKNMIDEDGYVHTGDIGYFDEDGYLFIVGRIKDIIKYKAFQVPPAYLEDILLNHPAIKDAAVIGKPDEIYGELPTAFVVRQPNVEVTEQEIVNYVAERVSVEKQLHGCVIFIEELPRSVSGKVLKGELQKHLV